MEGFICPGFVELQINGSFGVNVGPDGEALKRLARELPKTGTGPWCAHNAATPPT